MGMPSSNRPPLLNPRGRIPSFPFSFFLIGPPLTVFAYFPSWFALFNHSSRTDGDGLDSPLPPLCKSPQNSLELWPHNILSHRVVLLPLFPEALFFSPATFPFPPFFLFAPVWDRYKELSSTFALQLAASLLLLVVFSDWPFFLFPPSVVTLF